MWSIVLRALNSIKRTFLWFPVCCWCICNYRVPLKQRWQNLGLNVALEQLRLRWLGMLTAFLWSQEPFCYHWCFTHPNSSLSVFKYSTTAFWQVASMRSTLPKRRSFWLNEDVNLRRPLHAAAGHQQQGLTLWFKHTVCILWNNLSANEILASGSMTHTCSRRINSMMGSGSLEAWQGETKMEGSF